MSPKQNGGRSDETVDPEGLDCFGVVDGYGVYEDKNGDPWVRGKEPSNRQLPKLNIKADTQALKKEKKTRSEEDFVKGIVIRESNEYHGNRKLYLISYRDRDGNERPYWSNKTGLTEFLSRDQIELLNTGFFSPKHDKKIKSVQNSGQRSERLSRAVSLPRDAIRNGHDVHSSGSQVSRARRSENHLSDGKTDKRGKDTKAKSSSRRNESDDGDSAESEEESSGDDRSDDDSSTTDDDGHAKLHDVPDADMKDYSGSEDGSDDESDKSHGNRTGSKLRRTIERGPSIVSSSSSRNSPSRDLRRTRERPSASSQPRYTVLAQYTKGVGGRQLKRITETTQSLVLDNEAEGAHDRYLYVPSRIINRNPDYLNDDEGFGNHPRSDRETMNYMIYSTEEKSMKLQTGNSCVRHKIEGVAILPEINANGLETFKVTVIFRILNKDGKRKDPRNDFLKKRREHLGWMVVTEGGEERVYPGPIRCSISDFRNAKGDVESLNQILGMTALGRRYLSRLRTKGSLHEAAFTPVPDGELDRLRKENDKLRKMNRKLERQLSSIKLEDST